MNWVKDRLKEQENVSPPRAEPRVQILATPDWLPVWKMVLEIIQRDVAEFNKAKPANHLVSFGDYLATVLQQQPPVATVVFQIDKDTGVINVTCPPSGQGINRRGQFRIKEGQIISSSDFVGAHPPPNEPMTPEKFSKVILEPFLFPE